VTRKHTWRFNEATVAQGETLRSLPSLS
jgi:hypothetical protein